MRRRLVSAVLALVVGALPGCDVVDPLPVEGTMHASIEQRTTLNPNFVRSSDPWDAEKTLTATMSSSGNLVITGVENSTYSTRSTHSIRIRLTVYDATVGSFSAIGGEAVPKVEATYGDARTFSYSSAGFGGTALVNITELSATKAVGTFEFRAVPLMLDLEGTPSYRVVNGTFSVTIR